MGVFTDIVEQAALAALGGLSAILMALFIAKFTPRFDDEAMTATYGVLALVFAYRAAVAGYPLAAALIVGSAIFLTVCYVRHKKRGAKVERVE